MFTECNGFRGVDGSHDGRFGRLDCAVNVGITLFGPIDLLGDDQIIRIATVQFWASHVQRLNVTVRSAAEFQSHVRILYFTNKTISGCACLFHIGELKTLRLHNRLNGEVPL